MTIICVRCGNVISRYEPVEDRDVTLCGGCLSALAETAGAPLYCGHAACPLEVNPYSCLYAEATGATIAECPAAV